MLRKTPDDPELENIDPVMYAWMFHNWLEDFKDDHQMLENQGYLIGSFINPEAVSKMLGKGAKKFRSTDEEFDKATKEIFEDIRKEEASPKRKRRRRKKIEV